LSGYQFRDWVFTLNNPTPDQMVCILESEQVRFMIYQLERSNTGTSHMQGYVELKTPISFKDLLKIFHGGIFHLERRRGTREQARNYCSKEETRIRGPWIIGEWVDEDEGEEQCHALTKEGKRCRNLALPDRKRCGTHRN